MRLRSIVVMGFAAASIALCRGASADDGAEARAEREFVRGRRAFEANDYRTAAQAFEAAYAAKPHHDALFNAGMSWQRAADEIRAANLLERYLREAPADAPDRALAESVLTDVSKRSGRVHFDLVDVRQSALDGEPVGSGVLFVAPGEHVFTGETSKGSVKRVFRSKVGELTEVRVTTTDERPNADSPSETPPRPATGANGRAGLSPWLVVGGGGLVGLGAAMTTVFGLDAVSQRDAYLRERTQDRLDAVGDAQARTNVTLYTTLGVAAVTGIVALLLVDWRSPTKAASASTRTRDARSSADAWSTAR